MSATFNAAIRDTNNNKLLATRKTKVAKSNFQALYTKAGSLTDCKIVFSLNWLEISAVRFKKKAIIGVKNA